MKTTMKSMKRSPAEKKDMEVAPAAHPPADEYPYGLRLTLDQDSLEKLGIKLPSVGSELHLEARAKVLSCHASVSADKGGEQKYASCEIQVTDLAVASKDDEEGLAARLYKKKEA